MSTLKIEVQQNQSRNLRITLLLDDVRVGFEFFWNGFSGLWNFNVLNPATLEPVISGLGLSLGTNLLGPYAYLIDQGIIPPGVLWVQDIAGLGVDPGLDSFVNGEAVLFYQTVS
jgi:hypothetical protein